MLRAGMRILHLLSSPYWSGPAELVAGLAAAQRALGHEVTVAVDRLRTDVAAEELAVPRLQERGLLDEGGLALSVKGSPWRTWRDLRILHRKNIDVVHAHFSHDHFLARFGRPRRAKLVRSVHAPRSLRRSLPDADAWTLPTMDTARRFLGRRVMVLPPFVDAAFTAPADRAALREALKIQGSPLVGMVSTFQSSRRHGVAVEAFSQLRRTHPGARLVLVGDGRLSSTVQTQVASLGLTGSVTFAGYQSGASFVQWLQALDVVWILGLGNDWSGRAAAQARACGVRVIAVDEGGLAVNADVLVEATPAAVAEATRSDERRIVVMPTPLEIAADVLKLYA
jgi:glycosyltransferase involved in cell wall biosynthesis